MDFKHDEFVEVKLYREGDSDSEPLPSLIRLTGPNVVAQVKAIATILRVCGVGDISARVSGI